MDHPLKKKPQKPILNKLKSWTKKLVASPKSTNNSKDEQPEWNNSAPQITHASIDDSEIESTIIWSESINKNNTFGTTKSRTSRRNSFFGITRLNSRLSSRTSRVSNTTTSNNVQQSQITICNLPELIEEPFDIDFIFNDFDQLYEVDELEESDESSNSYEKLELEMYNALPIEEDTRSESVASLNVSPPNPTTLNPSLFYSPSLSESPFRISIMEVECAMCTYTNHPIMTVCELCRTRLPGPSVRSSQYSAAQLTCNNKSDPYPLMKTQMSLLNKNDADYITVENMFYSEIPLAFIKGIKGMIRLDMPTKLVKAHEKYKRKVAKISGKCIDEITFSMFHGTTTLFDCSPDRFLDKNYSLGDKSFCKKGCGMCGIIQYGNRKKFSKHSRKMWFAHSSLISRDYTDGNRRTKVMFVVDVVAEEHNWILVIKKNKATLPRFMILFE